MAFARSRIPTAMALFLGVALGWVVASSRPAAVRASTGDRSGEAILATGPVLIRYDEGVKGPVPLDAVYFLDYKGGRLLGTIPFYRQTAASTRLIETFVERDLVADFKLDLDSGPRPHFLMTTGSIGAYTAGWAPLYVFETTTSQFAVYRLQHSQTMGTSRPQFDLIEMRSYAKPGAAGAPQP